MKSLPLAAACALLIAAASLPCAAEQAYLTATFDDKTIDAPIGTAGPEAGEPAWFDANLSAIVRSAPFATPCLELQGGDVDNSYMAGFELVGGDVTTGLVVIITDLWFEPIAPSHRFGLRVQSANFSPTFLNVYFEENGNVEIYDFHSSPGVVATYATGRSYPVMIAFNQDARTYSVWLDGVQVVTDKEHGVSTGGIGLIMPMCQPGNSPGAKFWIDQIRVLDWLPPVPVESMSWGEVRALFRN